MPDYQYIAKDIKGKTIKGVVNAPDVAVLTAQLRGKQLFLLEAKEAADAFIGKRLKPKQLAEFNLQLGTMLASGVSLIRSFEIMLKRDITKNERQIYSAILNKLFQGVALSEAMDVSTKVFPALLINMYRSGEANGTLDVTAIKMADHYTKEYKLRSKIKIATTYPKILLVLLIVVMVAIFKWILPTFMNLYGDMELPEITKFVIGISKLFTEHLAITVIVLLILVFGVQLLMQIPAMRYRLDHLKLKLPVIGKLMRTIYTARFSRTLSSLYASGISILKALEIARGTVDNAYISGQFDNMIQEVRNGNALSAAVENIDGYDKKLASMVLVGEETGRLDYMLNAVADNFDYDAQQATDKLTAMVEPLMIILMAVLVGTVIISVMLPIYSLYDSIGMSGSSI